MFLENHRNGGIFGLGHSPNPVFFTYSKDHNMARWAKQQENRAVIQLALFAMSSRTFETRSFGISMIIYAGKTIKINYDLRSCLIA